MVKRYKSVFSNLKLVKDKDDAEKEMNMIADTNARKLASIFGRNLKRKLEETLLDDSTEPTTSENEDEHDGP